MSSEDILREKLGIKTEAEEAKGPTPYERLTGIHTGIHAIKQTDEDKSLDTGHEVLLRLIEDLRVYMGWPDNQGPTQMFWWLEAGHSSAKRPACFFEETTGKSRAHKCRLNVVLMGISVLVRFEAKDAKIAEYSRQWSILVEDQSVGAVDGSTFTTPHDVLKSAANIVSAALYDRTWR